MDVAQRRFFPTMLGGPFEFTMNDLHKVSWLLGKLQLFSYCVYFHQLNICRHMGIYAFSMLLFCTYLSALSISLGHIWFYIKDIERNTCMQITKYLAWFFKCAFSLCNKFGHGHEVMSVAMPVCANHHLTHAGVIWYSVTHK